MAHFIFNGKFYQEGSPVVSSGNRGLRYGDGVFETIKLARGKLILADEHYARLWKGMQVLGFDIPKLISPEKFTTEINTLAKKNGFENARVRLQVFRGEGGLFDVANNHPHYLIEAWALTGNNDTLNSNGLELGIYDAAKKTTDILSNLKHCNFLPYILAANYAKKERLNDALLVNQYGRICDSTIANIFVIKDGTVVTPALTEGCVAGIMRAHVISILKANGWEVNERTLPVEELLSTDEVFLTNSIYNLRWVKRIGSRVYGNTAIQKIYPMLMPTIV